MTARSYFWWVLGGALALTAGVYGLAWWLQPVSGDLARIGGYAARDFGWNDPQRRFDPPLARQGRYDRYHDVLVIGDSFANLGGGAQWQHWLARRTGWSIATLDKNRISVDAILASEAFLRTPPRVVIWNVVERWVDEDAAANTTCDGFLRARALAQPPQLPLRPIDATPVPVARNTGPQGVNPGFVRIWLRKNLLRIAGIDWSNSDSQPESFPIARDGLFSSSESRRILVYRQDRRKAAWSAQTIARIRCGLAHLRERFEANGKTRFVTALAPDKSAAYRPWLRDPAAVAAGRLGEILDASPVPDARLDRALARAIARGVRDVYLPDDTHWGSAGHRIAADAVLELLAGIGIVRGPASRGDLAMRRDEEGD